ncbi:MAG: hypothetical protein SGPRY_009394, partial [Prymnesium sp.]
QLLLLLVAAAACFLPSLIQPAKRAATAHQPSPHPAAITTHPAAIITTHDAITATHDAITARPAATITHPAASTTRVAAAISASLSRLEADGPLSAAEVRREKAEPRGPWHARHHSAPPHHSSHPVDEPPVAGGEVRRSSGALAISQPLAVLRYAWAEINGDRALSSLDLSKSTISVGPTRCLALAPLSLSSLDCSFHC